MRITIGRMMIVVAVSACLFAAWRFPLLILVVGLGIGPAFFCYLAGRAHDDISGRIFAVIAALCSLSIAIFSACGPGVISVVLMAFAAVFTVPLTLGSGLAWVHVATRPGSPNRRSAPFAISVLVVSVFLPLSMWSTQWPMRLTFLVSRPALNRLADRVASGGAISWPQRAGIYRLVGAKYDPKSGNVALIVDPDPAGNSGFVRTPISGSAGANGPLNNLFYDICIDGRWWYQQED